MARAESSQYAGVRWDADRNQWNVQLKLGGRELHIGQFRDEVEAAWSADFCRYLLYGLDWTNWPRHSRKPNFAPCPCPGLLRATVLQKFMRHNLLPAATLQERLAEYDRLVELTRKPAC